jgi:hypothetical protein
MSPTVPLALIGFALVALSAMAWRPAPRTVLALYIGGFLLLPVASFDLPAFSNFTKVSAIALSIAAGVVLFDSRRLARFTPRWIDLPIAVFCACPIATSLSNGLGLYNGCSSAMQETVTFGLPYLTGRLYFTDLKGHRLLATGIFLGGLAYVPLCLFEIRFSPQLHRLTYGFHQHEFVQTIRYGGFRPMVFLNHGLMLGMWMSIASLIGILLWRSGSLKRVLGMPVWMLVSILVATTVLCRSTGAVLLLAAGLALMFAVKWTRSGVPIACLVAIPVVYIGVRASDVWSGAQAVEMARSFGEERAQSIQFRFDAEDMLVRRALQQPVFGWGGFGRSTLREDAPDPSSRHIVVDGFWILIFGMYGAVGLTAIVGVFLVPIVALWRRLPPRTWSHPSVLPVGLGCLVGGLFLTDCLMNALVNPIYFMILGGVASVAMTSRKALALQLAGRTPARVPARRRRAARAHRSVGETADFLTPGLTERR